jgi:hypothetical protein
MTMKQLTIDELLTLVENDRLLLPSIQRDFVWNTTRISRLFDSLMRGYPIGSLLVWRTKPAKTSPVSFRRVCINYHGPATSPDIYKPTPGKYIESILDGQQRVTALAIALLGSHRGSANAPARFLHIDLNYDDESAGSERDRYDFRFGTTAPTDDGAWIPVSAARGITTDAQALNEALAAHDIAPKPHQRAVFKKLVKVVNTLPVISIETESTPELDRALHIFARTNTGAMKLTYVELLVSTAEAKMKVLKPAVAFPQLRKQLAEHGFDVPIDRILKAAFVLLGSKEPKFHVESMLKASKLAQLEAGWDRIGQALDVAVRLLKQFGLSDATLPAENVIIPLASFAYTHKWKPDHVLADATAADRARMKAFVARTLLIRGYWTGSVDAVLVAAHAVISKSPGKHFPLTGLEPALAAKGKPIVPTNELLDEWSDLAYSDRRTRVLLSLLFPHMSDVEDIDKDHIFPKSKFTNSALAAAKVPSAERPLWVWRKDRLANLQLLGEIDNHHKKDRLPHLWWAALPASAKVRYTAQGVKHLPTDLAGFEAFWLKRRTYLRSQISDVVLA